MHALRGVDFSVEAGEVHALVGENGAGKSTLIKILAGAVQPDAGEIAVHGKVTTTLTPSVAKVLGIAVIYQHPAMFAELTVTENIALALEGGQTKGRIDWRSRRQRAVSLLERVGANISPDWPASKLSFSEAQLVEIAKALSANARIIIMDEPTASLSEQDSQNLFVLIRELRGQGTAVIYISHRLEELAVIADRVTVLRDGERVDTRPMADVDRTLLVRLMAGRDISQVFPKRTIPIGEIALDLDGLRVHRGEILGIAGLVGAGRTQLAQQIFFACKDGMIAYLPEDRRSHGVIGPMSVAANVTLASLRGLRLNFVEERKIAEGYRDRLMIKAPGVAAPVDTLSGGNAQKVAIARWLATKPRVLILDEPTQGVDVGAKVEIHRLMIELAEQGMAIVMISSELPEILGMSDRIAVMRKSRVVATLDWADATQDRVLALMLGEAA